MKIDVRQLFDVVGERKTFVFSLDLSDEEYNGEYPFQTPVKVSGQIELFISACAGESAQYRER